MTDSDPSSESARMNRFRQNVESREARKQKSQREKTHSLWFGLGLSGLIGWSIAIPTVLGIQLGLWIDHRFPSSLSWTLMMMMGGLMIGCLNAWLWLQQERSQ